MLVSAPTTLVQLVQRTPIKIEKDRVWASGTSVLVVGGPGSGKTTFCRWNALVDAEAFMTGTSKVIPIYVALHRVPRSHYTDFDQAFLASLRHSGLLGGSIEEISRSTPLRLYLDGLDEVPDTSSQEQIMRLAKNGMSLFENLQIIATVRDHLFFPSLDWLPRVALGGLSEFELQKLVDQWLGGNEKSVVDFFGSLARNPALRVLMSNPLLATLTILVFRRKNRLPSNKAGLYRVFVQLMCGGWDLAKGFMRSSRFSTEVKMMVLSSLASSLHKNGKRGFAEWALDEAVARFVVGSLPAKAAIKSELLNDGIIVKTGGVFQFCHLSFQEFLTANDMIGDPDPGKITGIVQRFLDGADWWAEVLRFYFQIAAKPRESIEWLESSFRGSTRRSFLARLIEESFHHETGF